MKKWGALITLSLAMFVIVIDTTIMNVSISALVEDLSTTVSGVQAAISIYALVMAAFILIGGKLADIVGKKRIFVIGLIIYGTGTTIASFSESLALLIFGWSFLEGLGGALMIPNIQTILRSEYKGQDLAFAYGIIGAVGAVGAAVGPIVGGFFTTYFSWRWAFRTELLIVIIVLILSRNLRKDQLLEQRPRFDFLGAILSVLGWSTIVFGILLSQRYGLFLAKEPFVIGGFEIAPLGLSITPVLLGIGIILIILLLAWERHQEATGGDGLFKPSIFETVGITAGFATRFMQVGITAAFLYIFPLLLQLSFEFTAMETGLALMPFSISMLVLAIVGARLSDRFLAHQIIRVGWILAAAGLGALGASIQPGATFADLALGGLFGMGVGLIASQILNLILSSVDAQETAETAGLSSTFEQLGNSIGVALIGTVMLTTLSSGLAQGINDSAVLPEESKASLVNAAEEGVQLMSDSQFERGLDEVGADSEMAGELQTIYGESRTAAFQAGVALLIFAALLGLVLTISLPKRKLVDIQEQEEAAIPGAT